MQKPVYQNLFKPLNLNGLRLKNRITMAPLYLGYAAEGGRISRLLLHHYNEMAKSGAAMIMVENASITARGSGSIRTIRCDHNRYLKGLETLADTIHKEKSLAGLQINHAGRFAHVSESVAPSVVPAFGKNPRALTKREITTIQKQFAKAALRVKKAKRVGYMVSLAAAVKKNVGIPVIAAGRISTPMKAESILREKKADLIGLARMLWVDPDWPKKAIKGKDRSIIKCSPKCDACFQLVMKGKPAYCPRWGKERRTTYQGLFQ